MMRIWITIIFCLLIAPCISQVVIQGKVQSNDGSPLSNASIILYNINEGVVINFSISDKNGYFKIANDLNKDSIILKISLLGYKTYEKIIANKDANYNFQLFPAVNILKEVTVKNTNLIRQKKDTLNYSVEGFASKEDRVIADIIKKLPGVEVLNDGQILYQGKPIQAFLVNGLDLLEGKYNLANNNLPYDAVKNVQIIENDQRIKILDSLVFSDRTTLNLNLKKFLTTGTANIGIGKDPFLWDVNISPITFNKTFQAINSYQSNNIGNDKTNELKTLTTEDIFEKSSKPNTPLLNLQNFTQPPFDKQFWLNNNLNLLSSNFLKILKNEIQVKLNVSFYNDFQIQSGKKYTSINTVSQVVNFIENQSNSFNKNSLRLGFTIEKNKKEIYFKNNFTFEKTLDTKNGELDNEFKKINQKLDNTSILISNNIYFIKGIRKQLFSVNSQISYFSLTQNLNILPGQYDSLLNNNIPYAQLRQMLIINGFQTKNVISFTKGFNNLTISPKIGFDLGSQNLTSAIDVANSSLFRRLGADFTNNISFNKSSIFHELYVQYKINDWKIGTTLNLSEQSILYNSLLQSEKLTNKLLFQPRVTILRTINSHFDFNIYSNFSNYFGEINQLYGAYILQNYRNLQRSSTTIPEEKLFSNGIYFNYKNPLKGAFFSVNYSIRNMQNNLLFQNKVNSDGSLLLESIMKNNSQSGQSLVIVASKYISSIKTILKFSNSVSYATSEQFMNANLTKIENKNNVYGFGLNNDYFKHVTFVYDGSISLNNNFLSSRQISTINLQQHNFKINFFPFLNQMLTLNSFSYYYKNLNSEYNHVLVNLIYRMTFPQKKIEILFNCNNVLNYTLFFNTYTNGFTSIQSVMQMRPRQLNVAMKFSF